MEFPQNYTTPNKKIPVFFVGKTPIRFFYCNVHFVGKKRLLG